MKIKSKSYNAVIAILCVYNVDIYFTAFLGIKYNAIRKRPNFKPKKSLSKSTNKKMLITLTTLYFFQSCLLTSLNMLTNLAYLEITTYHKIHSSELDTINNK